MGGVHSTHVGGSLPKMEWWAIILCVLVGLAVVAGGFVFTVKLAAGKVDLNILNHAQDLGAVIGINGERPIGEVFDSCITHDLTNCVIMEAPCTVDAAKKYIALGKTGGDIAQIKGTYKPEPGFPRLTLVFQTYYTNNFRLGSKIKADEDLHQLAVARRAGASLKPGPEAAAAHAADVAELRHAETHTHKRNRGVLGHMFDLTSKVLFTVQPANTCQLRLYLAPDQGPILLESVMDDQVFTIISDLFYFNSLTKINADPDFKFDTSPPGHFWGGHEYDDADDDDGDNRTLLFGAEHGGLFGIFEKHGAVLKVSAPRQSHLPPEEVGISNGPPLIDRGFDQKRHSLGRRLHAPGFRFAREKTVQADAGGLEITGFGVVEAIGSADLVEAKWKWSKKLLEQGTVNWDSDGSAEFQGIMNRFRENTDHEENATVHYCPHQKFRYSQIAWAGEATAKLEKWLSFGGEGPNSKWMPSKTGACDVPKGDGKSVLQEEVTELGVVNALAGGAGAADLEQGSRNEEALD